MCRGIPKLINENVDLTKIVADLKNAVDQLNLDSIQAKRLIQELAHRLDELGKCEKSEISTKIKEILADKIKEHKITEKWIEDCLPSEYKRKYTRKSELSSLSKQIDNVSAKSGNTIDNGDGSALLINHNAGDGTPSNNRENTPKVALCSKDLERQECEISNDDTDPYQILQEENRQLKEIISEQKKVMMGNQNQSNQMEFMIPREKYCKIKEAMNKSKYFTYVTFDNSGIMLRVTADIFKTL
jgi:hypothetical protein